mmetsp:Transcript_34367/g.82807  ORF Transcript_34367/g.82807 Transcript_34367/m.82807 type:complete len:424 (-) Transcript_34367:51-1322(-)
MVRTRTVRRKNRASLVVVAATIMTVLTMMIVASRHGRRHTMKSISLYCQGYTIRPQRYSKSFSSYSSPTTTLLHLAQYSSTTDQSKNTNKSKTTKKGGKKNKTKKDKNIRSGEFWEAIMDPKFVWRPTINDVERISWGKPAKKKGTGSRGVPHRLNQDERRSFEHARKKGFLEMGGSGWRSERRDAPLHNTYRSLCDARGQPAIVLHKQDDGIDMLVVDISPLRTPHLFESIAQYCLNEVQQEHPGNGKVIFQGSDSSDDSNDDSVDTTENDRVLVASDKDDGDSSRSSVTESSLNDTNKDGDSTSNKEEDLSLTLSIVENIDKTAAATTTTNQIEYPDEDDDDEKYDDDDVFTSDCWYTRPIYQLPPYRIVWELQRNDAKALGKRMAGLFDTKENNKTGASSKKPIGVKPGKNRRHGGYGIG